MRANISTRRAFLTGQAANPTDAVYPPGVTDQTIQACSGCGHCLEVCPAGIIVMRSGVPTIDFTRGECTFCGKCAERCPERVFPPEFPDRYSHHFTINDSCLAINYVDCQACRDVCPTAAIRFGPRHGGPFIPELETEACSGCGACLAICPTSAMSLVHGAPEVADA